MLRQLHTYINMSSEQQAMHQNMTKHNNIVLVQFISKLLCIKDSKKHNFKDNEIGKTQGNPKPDQLL